MSTPTDHNAKSPAVPPTDQTAPAAVDTGTLWQPRATLAAPITGEAIEVPGYVIEGELGRGGMGVVYLAKNVLMNRPEVLKVVNKSLLDAHPDTAERFLREIQAAARLDHEHVVKAYSALRVGELLVFAMEYVEGEDLAKLVRRRGPLPVAHACHYISQAALGLQHAHERGMIHRDIKPGNLILARQGKKHVVKILDFGLAKAVRGQETGVSLTSSGEVLGTPAFMAPEQARSAANADIRTDIYSLGCTLYHLLTGSPPFTAKSHFAVLEAHESTPAPSLTQLRAEAPAELATVAAKMLAKNPASRYQQPLDVAKALAPIIKAAAHASKGTGPAKAATPSAAALLENQPTLPLDQGNARTDPPRQKSEIKAIRPAPRRKSSAGAWRAVVCGVVGIVILAGLVATEARLHILSGLAPFTWSSVWPKSHSGSGAEPAQAAAPFDAAQAKQLQKAWADYVGVPVDRETDLGNGVTIKLKFIPPGTFQMGSPVNITDHRSNELPQHSVEITRPFYIGVYAVTKRQFAAFVTDAGYRTEGENVNNKQTWRSPGGPQWNKSYAQTDDDPVVDVSWNDAAKFCEWLSKKGKERFELPTEAQWEYACRAGTQTDYYFGDDPGPLDDYAWYQNNAMRHTHPVGGKKPNPWGLYDMSGNAWQWCQDYYGLYPSSAVKDPIAMEKGPKEAHVYRGGSCFSKAALCRAAFRSRRPQGKSFDYLGLRVCLPLD